MLTENEIIQFINEDKISTKKRFAKIGLRYYNADHDIMNYRLFYFNSDGELVEDKTRSNIKIAHPFFTELVDQETQYILSGKNEIVRSKISDLQIELDKYFDDNFKSELSDVITGAIVKGFDYMYAYINSDGRLAFQHADSMGVVEVRARDTDDGCEYVIFWYIDKIVKYNKVIKRIQVHSKDSITYYVQEQEGKLIPDPEQPLNPRPYITYTDGTDAIYYEDFGYIPFFRLDNSSQQVSGLKPIKTLIDDYDLMSCGLSNNLADFDHPIHVVKGFQGDDLDELQHNLKTKKLIGVDENGGIEVHTVNIPYQARLTKMQEDEKNIYRFGMGFNSAQIGDGNVTNVVIKSRYALLDLKCNKLEIKLKAFLNGIIRTVLKEINKNNGTSYNINDVYIKFDREVMTNASDNASIKKTEAETQQIKINSLLSTANVLDDDTIIKSICNILDVDYDAIKDKIPVDEELNTTEAENLLNNVL